MLDLLDAFEREKTMWSNESLRTKELEFDKAKLGIEFISALVKVPKYLDVY
jgi:hypothetical protein